MSKKVVNTLTIAVGAALLGSVSLANASAAFQITDLAGGYMQLTAGEGKCGEGKCGMDKMDTNKDGMVSKAEHQAHADAKFAAADANKDGNVSKDEMAKAHEGKCGEGKCGEGKCGGDKGKEGACGGDKGKEGSCGGAH
jgi:uncharacterized low-complexity protein